MHLLETSYEPVGESLFDQACMLCYSNTLHYCQTAALFHVRKEVPGAYRNVFQCRPKDAA